MVAATTGTTATGRPLPKRLGWTFAGDDRSAPLDTLLADAALGTYRRFIPGKAGLELAVGLARRPGVVAHRGWGLAATLGKILTGSSPIQPSPGDRRFADPAWAGNPVLRRLALAYLATSRTAEDLVEDADLDWSSAQRMEFIVGNLLEALSPSNSPFTNPQALKAAQETAGMSLLRGAGNFVRDMSAPPRLPAMVDPTPFRVGDNIATSPGAVVLRTDLFELIQYQPRTEAVLGTPLLVIPPMINKFYVLDLAPGRSMIEYLVRQGIQVFVVSWRNPDGGHRDWGLDTYSQGTLDALDAVQRVTGADRAVLFGACSGGILSSMTAAHLAGGGDGDRLAGLTLAVTVLDQSRAGLASSVLDRRAVEAAAAVSARSGYLDGRTLAEVFAWLRPRDLVWTYWVNNYLLGKTPPSFDILFWNADVTRMPARLHRDFLELAVANALVEPVQAQLLGSPVDLSAVKTDAYVLAGVADHLCDWESCYRTVHLLGGESRFVLSSSGHVAAIVNPPGNSKAKYQASTHAPESPRQFLSSAERVNGSWWTDYAGWLRERCGPGGGRTRRARRWRAETFVRRSWHIRPRELKELSMRTDEIGRARGTDYFLIAEQLTESELDYLQRTRHFVDTDVLPVINGYWERAEFPFELVEKLAKLDLIGDGIEGYGCAPMSPIAAGLVNMELNRGDASVGTFYGVHCGLAMKSIAMLGSAEQKDRWLPPMARLEKIGAFALTEPTHGSDSIALETSARREGDGWVLDGRKRWIGNGTIADVIVVWARDTSDGQVKGFLVEKDTPGFEATVIEGKVALRSVWNADIELAACRVPESHRLTGATSFKDAGRVLGGTRNTVAWASLGHAVAAYEIALAYAKERHQFGKPLVSFQMIQEKLVAMLCEVTAMQLYCLRLARLIEEGRFTDTIAALAKLNNTVKARDVCRMAREILGGNGILLDYHVVRHMADMEALYTYEGTAEIQSLIVGRDITGVGAFA